MSVKVLKVMIGLLNQVINQVKKLGNKKATVPLFCTNIGL